MKLGEKADLIIKSEYGYGENGSPPTIPGGATLIFTVELVQIDDTKAAKFTKSAEELMKESKETKDKGNEKFKAQEFKEALSFYEQALDLAK